MSEEPAGSSNGLDAVIAAYKRDIDRTLLRENLRLTPEERLRKLFEFLKTAERVREAGRKATGR